MRGLFFLLTFLFVSNSVFAKYKYDFQSQELPLELQYLLLSLEKANQDSEEKIINDSNRMIASLSDAISDFSKAEIYFLIKTEIFKAVYEIGPGKTFKSNKLNFQINQLMQKMTPLKNDMPFSYWMVLGLAEDYRIFRNNNDPKMALPTPWLNFFNENDVNEIQSVTQSLCLSIIQRIIKKFDVYRIANSPQNQAVN